MLWQDLPLEQQLDILDTCFATLMHFAIFGILSSVWGALLPGHRHPWTLMEQALLDISVTCYRIVAECCHCLGMAGACCEYVSFNPDARILMHTAWF